MNGMHYHDGLWRKEPPRVAGPTDFGFWSGNSVFDGARAIRGCAPDLDRHCARLLRSAAAIGPRPPLTEPQLLDLGVVGIRMLASESDYSFRTSIFWCRGSILPATEQTAL